MKRLSRGTPYILTSGEIEIVLMSVTKKTATHIAQLLEMTYEDWEALSDRVRAKHIVDYQNSSILAASLAAGAKAHTDLEASSSAITSTAQVEHLTEEVRVLRDLVKELTDNANSINSTAKKGNRK